MSDFSGQTELSLEDITKMERELKQARSSRRSIDDPSRWPAQYIPEIQEAVWRMATTVNLGGETFVIRYKPPEHFFIRPENGFAPSGLFSYEWLDLQVE